MSTSLRRTAGRVAAAGLATLALTGAVVAGTEAAVPSTSSCAANPAGRALDMLLTLRSPDHDHTPACPSR
jgi:hypothetical protein